MGVNCNLFISIYTGPTTNSYVVKAQGLVNNCRDLIAVPYHPATRSNNPKQTRQKECMSALYLLESKVQGLTWSHWELKPKQKWPSG